MPFPTDRGYAALKQREDGTTTVMVSTGVKGGELTNVFAKHVGVDNVRVGPGIRLLQGSGFRYTDQVVEVVPGGGAIHIRIPDSRFSLPIT
jgi:hypothetical protein